MELIFAMGFPGASKKKKKNHIKEMTMGAQKKSLQQKRTNDESPLDLLCEAVKPGGEGGYYKAK